MIQRSDEWYSARLGKLTASCMADAMAMKGNGFAASRKNLIVRLAVERITGVRYEGYKSDAMDYGTQTEELARRYYSAETGELVLECGFIQHKTIPNFGASPDGLVGDVGLVEFKCPNSATHAEYLLSKKIPGNYMKQMLAQLASCQDRKWVDFVSFDPRMPDGAKLSIVRINRDESLISQIEEEAIKLLAEVDELEDRLRKFCDSRKDSRSEEIKLSEVDALTFNT